MSTSREVCFETVLLKKKRFENENLTLKPTLARLGSL